MKFRWRDMRGKWFDRSRIMKRDDPRYVRKQFVKFLWREAMWYAPEVLEGFMATVSVGGMYTVSAMMVSIAAAIVG